MFKEGEKGSFVYVEFWNANYECVTISFSVMKDITPSSSKVFQLFSKELKVGKFVKNYSGHLNHFLNLEA